MPPGRHRNRPRHSCAPKARGGAKASSRVQSGCLLPKGYLRRRYTRRAAGTSSHSSAPPGPGCDMLHPSSSAVEPGAGTPPVFVALGTGEGVLVAFGVAVAVGVGVFVGTADAVGVGVSVGGGIVAVSVGVEVGVSVGVSVSLGVGAGAQMPSTQT